MVSLKYLLTISPKDSYPSDECLADELNNIGNCLAIRLHPYTFAIVSRQEILCSDLCVSARKCFGEGVVAFACRFDSIQGLNISEDILNKLAN